MRTLVEFGFISQKQENDCDNQIKGVEILVFNPTPFWKTKSNLFYLDFLAVFPSFVVLALFCFNEIHPQPQMFFLLAIFITSFLSFCGLWFKIRLLSERANPMILVKYLCIYLIIKLKKFTYYFGVAISLILSRTVLSSFCNSFLYFMSASKLAPRSSFSLNLPVPRQPQVHTSFKICRQFSNASSSMEYGIQYPFLSLLTRPDCLNIFRCCDTAAGVMPTSSAIFLAPSGPLGFRRSIILTRVSTANTLKISEGTNFISLCSYSVKYFSNYLIMLLQKNKFVKHILEIFLQVKKNDT